MIPKITTGGSSFKGAFRYYLHDKGAETSARVAWAHTANLRVSDPAQAWKAMAYTARAQERLKEASGQSRAGRKLEKPVFAFSLAWHPEQSPTQDHMLETAQKAIAALGLGEHEHVIVAHSDEPQKHVHVIVNRVHPLTGLAGDVRNSKRKMSDFAREYEQAEGHVYCSQRQENHEKRQSGEKTRYHDPHIAEAWETTDSGEGFIAALKARGYNLAQGRKRIVVIDPHGKAHNPTRHLPQVKAKDLRARLGGLALPRAANDIDEVDEKSPSPAKEAAPSREDPAKAAAARMAALKEKHRLANEREEAQQGRRLHFAKGRLAEHFDLRAKKDKLLALKNKVANAPWWQKLLGVTRRDRKALSAQGRVYNEALAQYREKLSQIKDQGREALAALTRAQDHETRELALHLQRQGDAREGPAPQRVAARERAMDPLFRDFAAAQSRDPSKDLKNPAASRINPPSRSYQP